MGRERGRAWKLVGAPLLITLLCTPGGVRAEEPGREGQGSGDATEASVGEGDAPWMPLFELSLADTQFFAGGAVPDELEQIVPTSAALFLGELFLTYRWRLLTFFHLPLTPERSIVEGELVTTYSPPAIAAGLSYAPWWKDFREKRRLELQVALVGGVFLRKEPRYFPMTAVRLYLLHAEDMGIYLGMAYAFAPGTFGLIYGFGYRF
ncbi:MAG: hypothetical protein P1V51_07045 [Deltaproteobacteria bacterium]|nr:hypothetical protein [Deltaproteobacteria bacterium]